MRTHGAAVFVIATVPVLAAAQQFLPNFGPAVDPNTRFEVVAIKARLASCRRARRPPPSTPMPPVSPLRCRSSSG